MQAGAGAKRKARALIERDVDERLTVSLSELATIKETP